MRYGDTTSKTDRSRLFISAILLAAASNAQATIQTIKFDTDASGNPISAPSLFAAATPLTDLYAGNGVNFTALNRTLQTVLLPKDGIEITQTVNVIEVASSGMGVILNEAANFGHNARSGDNFLAFNNQSASSANFWRISFDNPIGYFGISWGRPNSCVTSRHFAEFVLKFIGLLIYNLSKTSYNGSRAVISKSNHPYGLTCSQISGVNAA